MSITETKRNKPKHLRFCFALSSGHHPGETPKQTSIEVGESASPLARGGLLRTSRPRSDFAALRRPASLQTKGDDMTKKTKQPPQSASW